MSISRSAQIFDDKFNAQWPQIYNFWHNIKSFFNPEAIKENENVCIRTFVIEVPGPT